jgi:hypothetical protein
MGDAISVGPACDAASPLDEMTPAGRTIGRAIEVVGLVIRIK